VRRAKVGTVSSVSTVVAFSLDWLLARSRRRTTAAAHYRHGHLTTPVASCLHADELHKETHKKVI
jgi:hypothetical protein